MMVERGSYVSYANCRLPYHVGGVIEKESSLLVASEQLFRERFAIDVRTGCEAIEISPKTKKVKLRSVKTGEVTEHAYDKWFYRQGRCHPSAFAGDRPSRDLSGSDGA